MPAVPVPAYVLDRAEMLPAKLTPSPEYEAVPWLPTARVVVVSDAMPPASGMAPSTLAPSLEGDVPPVGVPLPRATLTVARSATSWP